MRKLAWPYSFYPPKVWSSHRSAVLTRSTFFLFSLSYKALLRYFPARHARKQRVREWCRSKTLSAWLILVCPWGIPLVADSLTHTSSNFLERRTKSTLCIGRRNVLRVPAPLPWQPLLHRTTENSAGAQQLLSTRNRCHCAHALSPKRITWANLR